MNSRQVQYVDLLNHLLTEVRELLGLRIPIDELMRRNPEDLRPVEKYFRVIQASYISAVDISGYMARVQLEYLLRDLRTVRKHDEKMWRQFKKKMRLPGDDIVFHTTRFEVAIAACLILRSMRFRKTDPPDFTIPTPGGDVFIELTSRRLTEGSSANVDYRVKHAVAEKSKKGYAGRSTALCIDITNLAYNTTGTEEQLEPAKVRMIARESVQSSPFGAIILAVYQFNRDSRVPEFQLLFVRADSLDIDPRLATVLNIPFPRGNISVRNFSVPVEG